MAGQLLQGRYRASPPFSYTGTWDLSFALFPSGVLDGFPPTTATTTTTDS